MPGYPVTQRRVGEVWHALVVVRVPPSTLGGKQSLEVHIEGQRAPLGLIRVAAPVRSFASPTLSMCSVFSLAA
ncbi:MAG: hypothetical protein RMM31_00570 [Anaerolineae bacterium]|nr:hypothetical protein [Anaerolineae bacterium]